MSVQQNTKIARRVFDEVWSRGRLELADELLAPDFVGHPIGLREPFRGPEGAKEFIGRLREGFPDASWEIEELVADGDRVAVRWVMTGTHDGEFMGIDPTEAQVRIDGMTFLRFEDGKIVEGKTLQDAMSLMRTLGATPAAMHA
jgi:steroid delta-isomerase-like uncharacterized protein